ncbi:MAG TPA: hypothetical protein VGH28_04200 [Polyangiaceae bacterium]|jgi:hypothetical protein
MRLRAIVLIGVIGCGSDGGVPWDSTGSDAATTKSNVDSGVVSEQDASTTKTPPSDASTTGPNDAALVDDADYNTPTICTSGQTWTLGATKSANMEPGLSCRSCHVVLGQASGKDFDISGTVYPTAHEPDLCNGVPANMNVVITDANGADHVLAVNSVGNFYNDDALGFLKIPTPYTAKVVAGNNVRPMISSQTNGDCNSCHTEAGTQLAPGRIMAP